MNIIPWYHGSQWISSCETEIIWPFFHYCQIFFYAIVYHRYLLDWSAACMQHFFFFFFFVFLFYFVLFSIFYFIFYSFPLLVRVVTYSFSYFLFYLYTGILTKRLTLYVIAVMSDVSAWQWTSEMVMVER